MGRFLLAIVLLSAACSRDAAIPASTDEPRRAASAVSPAPDRASRISDEELAAFARWQREYMELLLRHRAELDAVDRDNPDLVVRDQKAFEARVAELVARQSPVMKALQDRVPLKGEQAELVTEAIGGIFHFNSMNRTGDLVVARDEVRLDAARRRFGKSEIDDIVARESLILPAGAVADAAAFDDVPGPADLDAYVSGAGAVRLGMTEGEVTTALGRKPSRRQDSGDSADVAWDGLDGPRPGAALGKFRGDRLYSIEFAPAAQVYPLLDYAAAVPVTRADYVRRSVARTLRMADIDAVTGVPGYRASWTVMSGFGSPTMARSRWMWDVDPGNKVLYVDETAGLAGQPVIRDKR